MHCIPSPIVYPPNQPTPRPRPRTVANHMRTALGVALPREAEGKVRVRTHPSSIALGVTCGGAGMCGDGGVLAYGVGGDEPSESQRGGCQRMWFLGRDGMREVEHSSLMLVLVACLGFIDWRDTWVPQRAPKALSGAWCSCPILGHLGTLKAYESRLQRATGRLKIISALHPRTCWFTTITCFQYKACSIAGA